eukprot:10657204-Lingulodinium_polyedra.AAC.1
MSSSEEIPPVTPLAIGTPGSAVRRVARIWLGTTSCASVGSSLTGGSSCRPSSTSILTAPPDASSLAANAAAGEAPEVGSDLSPEPSALPSCLASPDSVRVAPSTTKVVPGCSSSFTCRTSEDKSAEGRSASFSA